MMKQTYNQHAKTTEHLPEDHQGKNIKEGGIPLG